MDIHKESQDVRKRLQDGLNRTGTYVYGKKELFSTARDSIIQQLKIAKQINGTLNYLKMKQEAEEARRHDEEEAGKQTKEEIEQMIKSLDKHSQNLLTQARQQKNRFENIRKEEFISSKDTRDIEEKIAKVEALISEIHTLQSQKKNIATAVANIKKLLDAIKSDINLEKRLGRRKIQLLNLFIQSHRTLMESATAFKTEIENVVQAFSAKREAAEFMEKLTTAQRAIEEFVELEGKEGSAVERIGAFMQERNKVEQNIGQYLEQLKSELKSEGEIHSDIDVLVNHLNECKESLVHSEEAIVTFFQTEADTMNKSFEQLTKLEQAIDDVFNVLVPSVIQRTLSRLFSKSPVQEGTETFQ